MYRFLSFLFPLALEQVFLDRIDSLCVILNGDPLICDRVILHLKGCPLGGLVQTLTALNSNILNSKPERSKATSPHPKPLRGFCKTPSAAARSLDLGFRGQRLVQRCLRLLRQPGTNSWALTTTKFMVLDSLQNSNRPQHEDLRKHRTLGFRALGPSRLSQAYGSFYCCDVCRYLYIMVARGREGRSAKGVAVRNHEQFKRHLPQWRSSSRAAWPVVMLRRGAPV